MAGKGDFVVEVRPKLKIHHSSTVSSGEFVTELRSRSHKHRPPTPTEKQCQNFNCDVSDSDVQNILSGTNFTRERITQLLEGSIITLIEKLLTGRHIKSLEGQIKISLFEDESPIFVDLNKFLAKNNSSKSDHVSELNVKLRERDSPPLLGSCKATSPPHDFDRDPCHFAESPPPQSNHSSPSLVAGHNTDVEAPYAQDIPAVSSLPQREENHIQEAVNEKQRRRDSDEESGYTSNEKDDTDSPREHSPESRSRIPSTNSKPASTFNDYYCSGFDGKNTVYVPDMYQHEDASDEMDEGDDDDVEFETRLVIDENPAEEAMVVDEIGKEKIHARDVKEALGATSRIQPKPVPYYRHLTRENPMEESEDTDCPTSSDATDFDTDVPVDLSGDSKSSSDVVSVMPHPQSLVSRHPKGFRCKQCSEVLSDAVAVSKHALEQHELHCCNYCCRTFTAKNNLKRHVRLHTGQRPYKCPHCPQTFARRDDQKGHMLRHDYSKPFRCSLCKKGYTDRACVKNHMAKEHGSRLMHVCPQCGESFDQEDAFTAHKRSHPELQQFSCKTCSFIGTNNLMTLKHSLLHNHKLFSCKPCNAHFADPFDYTDHVRKHKKTSSFTHYICCFCDLALATYDQYVRHEYSHAQGKTHACKVCKKQFKSKVLLQEHALSHRNLDEEQSPMPFAPSKPVDDYDQGEESTYEDSEPRPDDQTGWAVDYVDHVHNQPAEMEDMRDEYEGELLDLSMKKPSSPSFSKRDSYDTQDACGNFGTCQGPLGLSGNCLPRNGYASGTIGLSQEREVSDRVFASYQSLQTERGAEKTYKHVFNVRENNQLSESNPSWKDAFVPDTSSDTLRVVAKNMLHPKTLYPERPKSAERNRVSHFREEAGIENRSFHRSISSSYTSRPSLRFTPYNRDKMADLAAKFIAARGPKLVNPSSKISMKQVAPIVEDRRDSVGEPRDREHQQAQLLVPSWQDKERFTSAMKNKNVDALGVQEERILKTSNLPFVIPSLVTQDNGDRSREDSDPETALRCHLPTFVKSDLMLEQEMTTVSSSHNGGVKDYKIEDLSSSISIANRNGCHPCDICKEDFGSFPELESHSVDIHKRYLCEHCGKSFTARPNRDRHVRYHTGERPYKCDLCDMAFFRGDDLKYHRTTRHPTAQPFVCTRCSASFMWGKDLEKHIRHSKCKA